MEPSGPAGPSGVAQDGSSDVRKGSAEEAAAIGTATSSQNGKGSGCEEQQEERPTYEQLYVQCKALQEEVNALKEKLDQKEEQRLKAIRLLKAARKRREEEKHEQERRERAGEERPSSPALSTTSSMASLAHRASGFRPGPGLIGIKGVVDPQTRLAVVLERLSSEPVLSALEGIMDQVQGTSGVPDLPQQQRPTLRTSFSSNRLSSNGSLSLRIQNMERQSASTGYRIFSPRM